jgi:dihydroflavonol-4-reductase
LRGHRPLYGKLREGETAPELTVSPVSKGDLPVVLHVLVSCHNRNYHSIMPETVLVTGASGFIGSNLALALSGRGFRVRAFYRTGDDARRLIGARGPGARIQRIEGNICDESTLVQAARGCSAVFHLAGNMSFRKADFNEQHKVNVEGTRAIVSACLQTDVRRLVHTSTVNAIGLPKPDKAIGDENTPWSEDMERFGYAVTKRQGERLALQACGPKLEVVVVNPGTVFGAGDVNANAGSYILAMARYPLLFYPGGGVSCAHIAAAVDGHIAALYKGRPGQRYILGGENLTYREIFAIIADVLGRSDPGWPYPRRPGPRFRLSRAAAVAVAFVAEAFGLSSKLSPDAARAGDLTFFFSSAKAERELGYRILPFRSAVEEAVQWYREEGFLR